DHLMHGKTSAIEHDRDGLFVGIPRPFRATRYHSLVVVEDTVPPELVVTARDADDGYIMALRHRRHAIESVQVHPESVYTEHGMTIIHNFLSICRQTAALPVAA